MSEHPRRRPSFSLRVMLLVLLTSAVPVSATTDINDVIPDSATVAGRLDLNQVLETPLGGQLFKDLQDNYRAINWFMAALFGFQLKQVDHFWFASDSEDRSALIMQGNFKASKVSRRLGMLPGRVALSYPGVAAASQWIDEDEEIKIAAVLGNELLAMGDQVVMERLLEGVSAGIQRAPRPALDRLTGSDAEIVMAMIDTRELTETDAEDAPLVDVAWTEIRFSEDLDVITRIESQDAQVGRGIEQMASGLMLVLARHPDVRANAALEEGVSSAQTDRQAGTVTVRNRVSGAIALAAAAEQARELPMPGPGAEDQGDSD